MTDTPPEPAADASISEKMDRLEEIISHLEDGEVSLERANELHSEGKELLEALEDELDLGAGEIVENR
ncbi:exodeoxyribonuclease VII small subunit [Halobacteria archaeon AArc-m2/3/4]|uniref:Exodeoxyribonuclease VII small subunit n=1 Tax=Natronoglomus mannanivorans TaxID=2979990 RepID=A0AAP2Z4S3_9EURY|nr:exodeoxyribonuclease VII small subunit [Halobacteria archaeon AArc-xg1-1]MCU4975712.1 exodeoxyribonuclease VII small subunit [Halobacteria archaeon AArc-m2/3/4]